MTDELMVSLANYATALASEGRAPTEIEAAVKRLHGILEGSK